MAQGKTRRKIISPEIVDVTPQEISEAGMPSLVGQSIASCATQNYNRGNSTILSGSCSTLWPNISNLGLPFSYDSGYYSIKDAVIFCQKAYYRIGIFKTAIDTMADLANTGLHLGGNDLLNLIVILWRP